MIIYFRSVHPPGREINQEADTTIKKLSLKMTLISYGSAPSLKFSIQKSFHLIFHIGKLPSGVATL